MDFDPLQDTRAPRYAVESDDDEDDLDAQPSPNVTAVNVEIITKKALNTGKPLVVAIGRTAAQWTSGLDIGSSSDSIQINGLQIGSLYFLPNLKINILTVSYTLPSYVVNTVAKTILTSLQPSNVVLLDSYPVPSYVSTTTVEYNRLPIRYLQTSSAASQRRNNILPPVLPFSPPNLIQSLPASLISTLESKTSPCTLFLLPSSQILPPPTSEPRPYKKTDNWEAITIELVNSAIAGVLGISESKLKWDQKRAEEVLGRTGESSFSPGRIGDIGEGAMYI